MRKIKPARRFQEAVRRVIGWMRGSRSVMMLDESRSYSVFAAKLENGEYVGVVSDGREVWVFEKSGRTWDWIPTKRFIKVENDI